MLYAIIAGILIGLFYALVGLGLNLIFGVMKVVNLAHGDFLMLGAFGAYVSYQLWHINPIVSVLIEFVVFALLGMLIYFGFVPRLVQSKDPEMLSLILFFGVSQVIEALATMAFGVNPVSFNVNMFGPSLELFHQAYPSYLFVPFVVSLVLLALMFFFIYKTKPGTAIRAIMGSRDEAAANGISIHRYSSLAFGIGIGLAAVAGVFAPFVVGGVDPTTGTDLTTISFAIIVIGSLGNPIGTIFGGLVYGISMMLMQTYLPSWASIAPYVLLILILLIRPSGILGRGVRHA
ncbi:amino acid ABC transporter [Alicyclobacillus ferrooxydans]|uniref:Amino acid ABC transporter n=1 Tax=Alicyclobacillus ferrooxydans TaxID=471514 RepID=A0A0P9F175_9BACL|nr:amino acid ABC transporter [Alicyclobacillus ferrooxydans]